MISPLQGLGTHFGHVYILDFNGNQIKKVSAHSVTVNELSIDDSGDFLASCSDDGMKRLYFSLCLFPLTASWTRESCDH